MENSAREKYLEAQLMAATPQKLRLILIEGALRFARKTLEQWEAGESEPAFESLLRCRRIVTELMGSIRPEQTAAARKIADVYLYLFRTLTEAQMHGDADKLRDVIRVLEIDRDTWQEVCVKMPHAPDPALLQQNKPKEITAAGLGVVSPSPAPRDSVTGGSFSLDA
jgi:flagellar protein FliS